MDKNALLYYQSASALMLSPKKTEEISGFTIKLAQHNFFFRGGATPFNYGSSISVAENKYCMNKVLSLAGFPVPKADAFSEDQFKENKLETLIQDLRFPLVVKPMMGTSSGIDVLCNITDIKQLRAYMEKCYKDHYFLSIEEFHSNLKAYRVLVFYNKVIGVVERIPASVTGDGIHTIQELIDIQNIERDKLKKSLALGPIKIDEECLIRLKELNLTPNTIPANNEKLILCYACNSARGGSMISLGKKIHKKNARMLCRAAQVLNLNMVGFDVLCEDICIPIAESQGVIIEANYNPDITIHENPLFGIPNKVSRKVMKALIFKYPVNYLFGLYQHSKLRSYINFFMLMGVLLMLKTIK